MIANRGSPACFRCRPIWIVLVLLLPAAEGRGSGNEGLGGARKGDWPISRHDLWNSGVTMVSTADACVPKGWVFQGGGRVWGYEPGTSVWSSAAVGVAGGRAVVAVGSYDHNLYLLDACTGVKLWHFATGSGIYGAPLLWQDGGQSWVFLASSDRLVYGLDAELGARRWSVAVAPYRPTLGGARLSSPTLGEANGETALFVGTWVYDKSLENSIQAGGLVALNARTGAQLWRTPFLDNRVSAPIFVSLLGRGYLYVASEDGNLRALDADSGRVLWSHRETQPIKGSPAFYASPDGPRVLIGSHFGKLRSLDALTGAEVWSFKTGYWITGSPAIYREGGRELVAIGSYDQRMYGLDARSGEKIWSYATGGPIYSSAAVVPGDGDSSVLFSAFDDRLYGVSGRDGSALFAAFTGEPIWDAISLGESNWSSPVAASINGRWMIFHGSYSGTFLAIPLKEASLASSSEPVSNARFLVTMLLSMGFTAAVALILSRKNRRRSDSGEV